MIKIMKAMTSFVSYFNSLNFVLPSSPRYPRASIAIANSSARLKAFTNNGTSSGIMAFIRSFIFPVRKSTPLDACALDILSVSCISVGINLSDIVIINANSCTGNLIFFIGPNKLSVASVISIGVVMIVNREVININKQKRIELTSQTLMSTQYNIYINILNDSDHSFVKNNCNKKVNIIRNQIGVTPFILNLIRILVMIIVILIKRVSKD